MTVKVKTRTEQILIILNILAWVAFIGFMIEAGVYVVSYAISVINPDAARNFYSGLDLHELRQFNGWHYTGVVSFMVAVTLLKSYVAFLAIKVLSTVNMANPFTEDVAALIDRIAYGLLGTWVISMLGNAHIAWIMHRMGALQGKWFDGDFIFRVGLVFIIAQVFKRGVELQSDRDLTV